MKARTPDCGSVGERWNRQEAQEKVRLLCCPVLPQAQNNDSEQPPAEMSETMSRMRLSAFEVAFPQLFCHSDEKLTHEGCVSFVHHFK